MPESFETSRPSPGGPRARPGPCVVGIGASAGGIGALRDFFAHVDPQGGTAYVVIVHLSPDHDSRLAAVLQPTAAIPVIQVGGTTPIAADHVYVVPPNKSLGISGGALTVTEFTRREQRLTPVDAFFRGLADTNGSRSACVILSGTGHDGSAGLKQIKEYGGLVIAQDPLEAEYADMPRNAIATGLVDVILPVAAMPPKIAAYFAAMREADEGLAVTVPIADEPEAVREVLTLLRVRTGHDFSNYKAPTVARRIERRMNLRGVESASAYARLVRREPTEAVSLLQELLISVTHFFRDPDAWSTLQERVVPQLFFNKGPQDQVRVWVAGCASGEEAYSIAMLLSEYAAAALDRAAVQVFATDLDQSAIERARDGLYSESEIADVPEDRLQRFFQHEPRGYRIRRDLREIVLFATHNLLRDPPFSHLDLICCRNVLIYLNRQIQPRVLETFHFALRPGGYLFLGHAETPDGQDDLFMRFDREAHIYESRTVTSRVVLPRPDAPLPAEPYKPRPRDARPPERMFPADLHQQLLERYAPPSLVANAEHNVVHMSERVGRYLQIRGGEPSRDLLVLVRPELRGDLRNALHRASRERAEIDVLGVTVAFEDGTRLVDMHVKPVLREGDPANGFFVVLFEDRPGAVEPPVDEPSIRNSEREPLAEQLGEAITRLRAELSVTVEQYETQVEEAKASNEELLALNEELRSAAEELQTSKEELQSLNEELSTVNQELKTKIDELGLINSDFQNFVNASDVGTIFLDRKLKLKFSTARARELFNLRESDIGRPLADITNKLRDKAMHTDVQAVIDRLTTVEREVQSDDGRWYVMRVLPYRTTDNRLDGVVITFQDITERHAAELRVRQGDERLRLLIDSALEYAMFTMNDEGVIDSWNPGAQRMFGYTPDEIVGTSVGVLFTPEDRARGVDAFELQEAARTGRAMDERIHVRKDGGRIYCSGVTRRMGAGVSGFAKIARDLTAKRAAAEALQRANDDLEARIQDRVGALAAEVSEHQAAKGALSILVNRLVTAQEDERKRIARDLHDDLGQRLTALRLMLERSSDTSGDSPPGGDRLEGALRLIEEIGSSVDFLSWQLRPAVLDELGLGAALPRYVGEWSVHVGIPVEFRLGGYEQGQLPPGAELAFYRVTQEALNNVAKHAQATRVDVVLGASDGHVTLVIEDDGSGFDVSEVEQTAAGFGLLGMRERAALVGATLQVESSPGRGTALFLKRPIERGTGGEPTPA